MLSATKSTMLFPMLLYQWVAMDCNTRTNPPLSVKKILLPPPKDDTAIADDTPAVIPNETSIAIDTADINEHVKGASFEAMDVDEVEATNEEEKHGVHVCKIMMNIVAPSSEKYAQKCGTIDLAV